jgi:hypothetical protein
MSDASVAAALHSTAPLVVIEAPAGCGKTHQGAAYARDMAQGTRERLLIVTHTHAACGVFADRTSGLGRHVEIRTIDSLIAQICGAYHAGLGLPADIAAWTRRTKHGHKILAARVAQLVARYPIVATALATRYPTIVCDEHQDSSADQHAIVMALLRQGARVRIFGDPMQHIYKDDAAQGVSPPCDWAVLVGQANAFADLDRACVAPLDRASQFSKLSSRSANGFRRRQTDPRNCRYRASRQAASGYNNNSRRRSRLDGYEAASMHRRYGKRAVSLLALTPTR